MITTILFLFFSLNATAPESCGAELQAQLDSEIELSGGYEITAEEFCQIGGN